MGWNFPWTEGIKKRISKYFLQRYIGSFLREKLTLDQLSVDLYNGTGSVRNLQLDVEKINELLTSAGLPLELVDGFVRRVTVSVPWSSLLANSTSLEVEGLELTLKPSPSRGKAGSEMDISRLSQSMTSSLQIAQDCLSSTGSAADVLGPAAAGGSLLSSSVDEGFSLPEGMEAFVKTIDFVLVHIRVTLIDTVARLEHMLSDAGKGVALEVRIARAEYFDDACETTNSNRDSSTTATASGPTPVSAAGSGRGQSSSAASTAAAFAVKNVRFSGVDLLTDEFSSQSHSTYGGSLVSRSSEEQDVFYSMGSGGSRGSPHASLGASPSHDRTSGEEPPGPYSKPVRCATLLGEQRLKIRLKLNEHVAGPLLAAEVRLGSVGLFFSPRQVHALSLLLSQLAARSDAEAEDSPDGENWSELLPSLPPQHLQAFAGVSGPYGAAADAQMLQSINIQDDGWRDRGLVCPQPQMLHLAAEYTAAQSQMFQSARMDNVDLASSTAASTLSSDIHHGQDDDDSASVASSNLTSRSSVSGRPPIPPPSAMRVAISVELAFALAVLTHDNLRRPPDDLGQSDLDLAEEEDGTEELELASRRFFGGFAGQRTKGIGDLKVIRTDTVEYCPGDHLKLILKALKIEMKEQQHQPSPAASASATNVTASSMTVTVGNCEVTEWSDSRPRVKGCEPRPYHAELLAFSSRDADLANPANMMQSMYDTSSGSSGCIRLTVTSNVRRRSRRYRRRRQLRLKTETAHTIVNVQLLRAFRSELDVSLYDRLYNLRTPPAIFCTSHSAKSREMYAESSSADPIAIILVSEYDGEIVLRIPIADLRGAGSPDRFPWQLRNLRQEALRLRLSDPTIRAMFNSGSEPSASDNVTDNQGSSVELTFTDVTCSFLLSNADEEKDIFCAHRDLTSATGDRDEASLPSIVLSWRPDQRASMLQQLPSPTAKSPSYGSSSDSRSDSLSDIIVIEQPPISPFSGQQTLCNDSAKRVIVPGTKKELGMFASTFSSSASFTVGIHVPQADVLLRDRATLELLYNRVCNDLLMWEPLSPSETRDTLPEHHFHRAHEDWQQMTRQVVQSLANNICLNPAVKLPAASRYPVPGSSLHGGNGISYGRSGSVDDDCSSVDETSSCASSAASSSVEATRRRSLTKRCDASCKTAVRLLIDRGTVLMQHVEEEDALDDVTESRTSTLSASTAVFAGQGDRTLPVTLADITRCDLFFAGDVRDDPNLQLCSVQLDQLAVYHAADFLAASWPTSLEGVEGAVSLIKEKYQPLAYLQDEPARPDLAAATEDDCSGRDGVPYREDMIAVAVQLKLDPGRKLKDILVALRLSSTAVSPFSADPTAFLRLKEFFDLTDYDILGYTFPKVVTEFHAHAASCAADLRLPDSEFRALVVVDKLEVTSNVVTNSPVNALSVIIEDAALFLAKCEQPQPSESDKYRGASSPYVSNIPSPVDVCVMDLGHFSAIFRTTDGSDRRYPKIDIQIDCNILHVRTCHDSLRALIDLVRQIVEHGTGDAAAGQDGPTPIPSLTNSAMSTSDHAELFDADRQQPAAAGGQQHVPSLLDEAMSELSSDVGAMATSSASLPMLLGGCSPSTGTRGERHVTAMSDSHISDSHLAKLSSEYARSSNADDVANMDGDFYLVESFPACGEPRVEFIGGQSEPFRCREYFERPLGRADQLKAPSGTYPDEVDFRYTLQNLSVVWHIYGGEDFGAASSRKTQAPFGSSRTKLGEVARRARGGRGRDVENLIELQLSRIRAQHEMYSDGAVVMGLRFGSHNPSKLGPASGTVASAPSPAYVSRTCLLLGDIEIRDRLQTSCIDKLLYLHSSDKLPKQTNANAALLKVVCFKAEPAVLGAEEECNIRASVQPLRLNLDQDAILFVHSFATKVASSVAQTAAAPAAVLPDGRQMPRSTPLPASPGHEPKPCIPSPTSATAVAAAATAVGSGEPPPDDVQSLRRVVFDEMNPRLSSSPVRAVVDCRADSQTQRSLFIKSFEFTPDLSLRLDYVGKGFSSGGGSDPALPPVVRVIAGFAHLSRVELRLRELRFKHGILGVERLLQECARMWQQDLRDQLAVVVGGVGPASSLVQIYNGVRDLFVLPVEQYKKDGRLTFGVRRGANAFGVSTAAAFLELTNTAVQTVLLGAELMYDLLAPAPASGLHRGTSGAPSKSQSKKRRAPPSDIRQGLVNAAEIVSDGVCDTTTRIVDVATAEHAERGLRGAVGGVLRQLPPAAMEPVILMAKGTSEVLLAARNQLMPDTLREERNKWRHFTEGGKP